MHFNENLHICYVWLLLKNVIALRFNNIRVSSLKTAIASKHLASNWYCNTQYIE